MPIKEVNPRISEVDPVPEFYAYSQRQKGRIICHVEYKSCLLRNAALIVNQ